MTFLTESERDARRFSQEANRQESLAAWWSERALEWDTDDAHGASLEASRLRSAAASNRRQAELALLHDPA